MITINILQIGYSYQIYINKAKEPNYTGNWKIKWGKLSASFVNIEKKRLLCLKRKFKFPKFWKTSFLFEIQEKSLEIKPQSLLKGHWRLQDNNDIYDFYLHKGLNYSLYKNNIQVASFSKARLTYLSSDAFQIKANQNISLALLVGFALFLNIGNENLGNSATIDLGVIGHGFKPINKDWKPAT